MAASLLLRVSLPTNDQKIPCLGSAVVTVPKKDTVPETTPCLKESPYLKDILPKKTPCLKELPCLKRIPCLKRYRA